ncbi:MAG: hypothetical protein FJZ58_06380 [Chlamydiae bacterium]|nr:hypothetical protein [Chlamydiota bacterium]
MSGVQFPSEKKAVSGSESKKTVQDHPATGAAKRALVPQEEHLPGPTSKTMQKTVLLSECRHQIKELLSGANVTSQEAWIPKDLMERASSFLNDKSRAFLMRCENLATRAFTPSLSLEEKKVILSEGEDLFQELKEIGKEVKETRDLADHVEVLLREIQISLDQDHVEEKSSHDFLTATLIFWAVLLFWSCFFSCLFKEED